MKRYKIYQDKKHILTIESNDPAVNNPLLFDPAYQVVEDDLPETVVTPELLAQQAAYIEELAAKRTKPVKEEDILGKKEKAPEMYKK